MKRNLFIPIMLFIMLSCSKEQDNQNRELNISLKSTALVPSTTEAGKVTFYPNPFHDVVAVHINNPNDTQIIISNAKGDKKSILITTSDATLDFSNEKAGAYYFEVLVNKTIYRTYLIKY